MSEKRIPLTVIGGYLGAGKTTFLNHILRHNEGRRLAVIVNDFGAINIDAELIESQEGDQVNLANGCICCSLSGSLGLTLYELAHQDNPPEHIVIEASGVADPAKVAWYGQAPLLRLDGVIVLADAEIVRQKAHDTYVGWEVVNQLQGADVIILNKVDLVTEEAKDAVRAWLTDLVPGAHIIDAVQGVVPLTLVLGDEGEIPRQSTKHPGVDVHDHDHRHSLEYETWSYETDVPLDGEAFRAVVEALPTGVIRAKGILNLAETPRQRTVFQLVGKRWSLKAETEWDGDRPLSQLVLIGLPRSVDAAAMQQMMDRAQLARAGPDVDNR